MTLADRRRVIEVLLCAGMVDGEHISSVALEIGLASSADEARIAWLAVSPSPYMDVGPLRQYELDATEAAESSPALRREWFGAR